MAGKGNAIFCCAQIKESVANNATDDLRSLRSKLDVKYNIQKGCRNKPALNCQQETCCQVCKQTVRDEPPKTSKSFLCGCAILIGFVRGPPAFLVILRQRNCIEAESHRTVLSPLAPNFVPAVERRFVSASLNTFGSASGAWHASWSGRPDSDCCHEESAGAHKRPNGRPISPTPGRSSVRTDVDDSGSSGFLRSAKVLAPGVFLAPGATLPP